MLPILVKFNPFILHVMIYAFIVATLALSWNILGGHCGQISFGHAAFFGTGAYISALIALKWGWSPALSILMGTLIGGISLSAIGVVCFRLRGPYFALAMLAFGDILKYLIIYLKKWTEGPLGLYGIPSLPPIKIFSFTIDFYYQRTPNYYVFMILMLITLMVSYKIKRSKYGLAFSAIRDDEDAAEVRGIDTFQCKMLALLISAFFTALTGALYAHYIHYLEPEHAYSHSWSILPIIASLFGGMRYIIGPCIGGILINLVDIFVFRMLLVRGHKIFLGLLLILVILFMPHGFLKQIERGMRRKI
jgi:branched-chain amino acid transport system permease protein